MTRIAVAGGAGLGYLIAKALSEAPEAHSVVVLSRYNRPEYAQLGVQVLVTNYNDSEGLEFSLRGVQLVISVIRGPEQLALIRAAVAAGVQRFVPAEFEGKLDRRPSQGDGLDPDNSASEARNLLRSYENGGRMRYTIFSCGILMETFHSSGLAGFGMGSSSGLSQPGSYLLDIPNATAEIVERNERGHSVRICLTSVYDVANFIVAAVQLNPANWPNEYTMRGDRLSLRDLVGSCGRHLGIPMQIHTRQVSQLVPWITHYHQNQNYDMAARYQRLLATASGRYEFSSASLNEAIGNNELANFRPMRFSEWLRNIYQ